MSSRPDSRIVAAKGGVDDACQIAYRGTERSLAAGDLPHAAHHAELAIALAPTSTDVYDFLTVLAKHPAGGSDLFPVVNIPKLTVSRCVASAHVRATEGDPVAGLILLLKAQEYDPEGLWAQVPWVTDPHTAAQIGPGIVAQMAAGDLVEIINGSSDSGGSGIKAAMAPYVTLIRHSIAAHPDNPELLRSGSRVLRRFDPDEALAHVTHAEEMDPSFESAVAVAMAHRELGHPDQMLQALERGADRAPDNVTVHADAVDLLIDADRLDEALEWVQRGLARQPDDLYMRAADQGVRYALTQSAENFDALTAIYHEQPDDSREQGLIGSLIQSVALKHAVRVERFGPDGHQRIR